jgi:hypothetical protein
VTDLLASLNNDQRILIACIGDPFLRYERWPLFEYVEAELDKDDSMRVRSLPPCRRLEEAADSDSAMDLRGMMTIFQTTLQR